MRRWGTKWCHSTVVVPVPLPTGTRKASGSSSLREDDESSRWTWGRAFLCAQVMCKGHDLRLALVGEG